MINTQTLKGNFTSQDYTMAFTLSQGDKGVPFKVELLENGTPYTLLPDDVVTIEWLKPNGSAYLQEGNIKYGTNYIEFTTPEAISQYAGSGTFNIIISDGTVRKGTIRREYKVVATSMTPGSVSEDVITDAMTELRELNSTLAATIQTGNLDNYAKKTYVNKEVELINSSLEEKVNKDKLGFYVVDELPDFDINDVSICINKALLEGKHVRLLEKKYFLKAPIILQNQSQISGYGKKSILRIADNYSIEAIKNEDTSFENFQLNDFCIGGNLLSTPDIEAKDIIKITNPHTMAPKHVIKNIDIYNVVGNGFVMDCGGVNIVSDLSVINATGKGIKIKTEDSWFTNLNSGCCGEEALYLEGNNNSYTTFRCWQSQGGCYSRGSRHMMIDCQAQDCLEYGFNIGGWNNKLEINVDTVGAKSATETYEGDTCGIILDADSGRNMINGVVYDRKGYIKDGTLDYAIDINGTGHIIKLIVSDIKVNPLKNTSYKNTNTVTIKGSYSDSELIRVDSNSYSERTITLNSIITASEDNSLLREGNVCQIKLRATGTFASGSVIGTVDELANPRIYSIIPCYYYNDNNSLLGVGNCDISNSNGNITLWDVTSGATKLVIFGTYIAKDKF